MAQEGFVREEQWSGRGMEDLMALKLRNGPHLLRTLAEPRWNQEGGNTQEKGWAFSLVPA